MSENKIQYECELIQDLLPLYQDNVCSNSSKRAVEDHLQECDNCRNMMRQLKSTEYDEALTREKNGILDTHARKERRRSTTIGLATAGVLMIPVIVCLICNLAIGHALDWFFIVLASLLLVASITVLPLLAYEKKVFWTMLGFTGSLVLLLLVTCIYSKGNWFFLAIVPIIFGLSIVFMPYIIYQVKLPKMFENKKGLLVMTWDTLWLYAIIFVCGLHSTHPDYWRVALQITTFCILLPWAIFLCIRYLPVHAMTKAGVVTMITGGFVSIVNEVTNGIVSGSIHIRILDTDFSRWDTIEVVNGNVMLLILLTALGIGLCFIGVGSILKRKKSAKKR